MDYPEAIGVGKLLTLDDFKSAMDKMKPSYCAPTYTLVTKDDFDKDGNYIPPTFEQLAIAYYLTHQTP